LVAPPAESDQDLTDSDWAKQLEAEIDHIVASWSDPAAWDGMTCVGNPTEMPAAMIGGMVLGELVVHGWDLAHATGQHPRWSDDVLQFTYDRLTATARAGRWASTGRKSRCRQARP
jgi:uncharacterized protein (TIGR03086 family)